MSLPNLKSYFLTAEGIESLPQLRQRILDRFLISATAIGSILFAISWIPIYQKSLFPTFGIYCLIYISMLLITFVRRIPYRVRVGGYLLLFYLLGMINLSMSGFNVDAGLFLLALIAMTVLLTDFRGGLIAIGLSSATVIIMGFLVTTGTIKLSLGLPQKDPLLWIIGGVVFLLMGFLLILAFTAVVRGLDENLTKAHSLSKKIEMAYAQQRESDERFRALIDASTDIIAILELDGTIKYISPSVEMVLGFTVEEISGQNVFNYIHPEDNKIAYDALGPSVPAELIGPKLDLRLRHKDGTWRDLEIRGREQHSTPGIMGTIVNCRDITVRKRALAELRESSLFLQRMFSGLCDGVIISDIRTDRIMDCNAAALELFGYTKDELVGQTTALLHVDRSAQEEFFKQQNLAVDERGVLTHLEYRMKRKGGALFPVEISVTPLNDSEGKTTGWVNVIRDISLRILAERMVAEEREALKKDVFDKTTELQRTNERLRELIVISPSVIYSMGVSGDPLISFITENIQSVLGYSPQEIIHEPEFWMKHVHPEDSSRVLNEIKSFTELDGGVIEFRFLHQDGSYRWIHDEVRVVRSAQGNLLDIVGSWFDMTDRKQVEEALKASETKYRNLYTGMMDAFVNMNMDGFINESNEIYQKMLGYAPDELRKLTNQDLTPPKWHPMESELVEKQILRRGYSDVYEKEYIRKDGSVFPVELRSTIIRDDTGNPTGMWALVRDISDRKRIENTLHTSEERYRALAEAAHDIIFIVDSQDRIQYVNTFAAENFRCSQNDMIGQPRSGYFKSSTGDRQKANLAWVFHSGEALYVEEVSEFPGSTLWLSTWLVPFKDASGNLTAVLGVSRDISEQKKGEQTLLRFREQLEEQVAERTAELVTSQTQLRTLANQVVTAQEDERRRISRELHDEAGQALISLKYNLDSVLSETPWEHPDTQKKLTDSIKIIDQTMDLIRSLSHSLRPPVMDVGGLNLSLQEMCWDFSKRTGLQINYRGEDIPGLPDDIGISLYRFAQEAVVNILKHSQATEVELQLQFQHGKVTISVRDNGKGMDPRTSSNGIGLLGIEERIDLLGGSLDIQSRPGKGVQLTARVPWAIDESNK